MPSTRALKNSVEMSPANPIRVTVNVDIVTVLSVYPATVAEPTNVKEAPLVEFIRLNTPLIPK